jgi:hypothetical protein
MSHKTTLLNYLQKHGSITSMKAIKKWEMTRLADVVFRLKKDGHVIITTLVPNKRRSGNHAVYTLQEDE